MAAFPRTYGVVRSGQVQTATVHDADELFTLRAELELTLRFGAGATEEIVRALDARERRLRAEGTGDVASAIIQLADMRSILIDGMAPANLMAARCMDADFPTLCGALDMDEIKNESDQFHQDVAAEISASGVPDADALAEAFAEATADAEIPKSTPREEPEFAAEPLEGVSMEPVPTTVANTAVSVEAAAQVAEANLAAAEDLLAQIEAGQDLLASEADSPAAQDEPVVTASDGQDETASTPSAETTAETLSTVQDELATMSGVLSATADEFGALTETVAAAVGITDAEPDAALAAAMADMLAPAAEVPEVPEAPEPSEPIESRTEATAAPPVDMVADAQDSVSETAAPAALDAALAEAMETGSGSVVGSAADAALSTDDSVSEMAELLAAETAAQSSVVDPEASKPLDQPVEQSLPEGDPLAELLKPAGPGDEDAVQAEAFAALLKEPSAEDDATLAAMLAAASSECGTAGATPAVENPCNEIPAEQPGAVEAPTVMADDVPCPQVAASETVSTAPADEVVTAVVAQAAVPEPSTALDEATLPTAAKPVNAPETGEFRSQLDDIKNTLVSQIDRLGGLFESVARMHEESQQTLAKALEVKQATDQAFEASRQYADAFAKAELARAACEQAEAQVAAARTQWENAQQGASVATQGVSPPAKAPKRSPRKRGGS